MTIPNFYEFPNGWFRVISCKQLLKQKTLRLNCLDGILTIVHSNENQIMAFLDNHPLRIAKYSGQIFVYYEMNQTCPHIEFHRAPFLYDTSCHYKSEFKFNLPGSFYEPKENTVDFAHFNFIHHSPQRNDLSHFKITDWNENFPTLQFKLQMMHGFCGIDIPIKFQFYFMGPGLDQAIVEGPLSFTLLSMALPVETHKSIYFIQVFSKKSRWNPFSYLLHKMAVFVVFYTLKQDFFIWKSKRFSQNPVLTPNDKFIVRFRRYYRKFFQIHKTVTPTS